VQSGEDIRRYTAEQLRARRARGESQTDGAAVHAETEAELEADIASDPDWADIPADWYRNAVLVTSAKRLLSLRINTDIVDWFREQGPGYQTRMNAVLRAYMQAHTNR
jgi:uncharacterized protein (DUF4415 family)